ncbi:MAG: MBOAT family protein [Clostridia bacterium]|nr:MBOAT family protein [Clostridia bacterium]
MLFNSLQFLLFFPAVLLVFHLIPKRYPVAVKTVWLLVCSYYFYMCWNAAYALLMLFSTAVTWFCGLCMDRVRRDGGADTALRWILFGGIGLNLAVLFFFKYFHFFWENLSALTGLVGIPLPDSGWDLLLPVGISFYTFQAVGYAVDVYRGDIPAERSFLRYALFVSFFPQLVAGPIERSGNLLSQLAEMPRPAWKQMRHGFLVMLWGFYLKMVIADRAAVFVDTVYGAPEAYPGAYIVVATVLFAFQIYCDFAGYSTIAMGASEMLGIRLMQNFETPYFSLSVREFWRRWHVSLSSWFRDYLYIPLGGSRAGTLRKYRNLLLVFFFSGLWHGAQWTYVIWGLLNGLYQIAEDVLGKLSRKNNAQSLASRLVHMLVTFVLIDLTWVFFRAEGVGQAFAMLKSVVTAGNWWVLFDGSLFTCGLAAAELRVLLLSLALLFAADLFAYRRIRISDVIERQPRWFRWPVYLAAILTIVVFGVWGSGYSAAGFIYFQF